MADQPDDVRILRPYGLEILLAIGRTLHEDFGAELVELEGGFPAGTATFRLPVPSDAELSRVQRVRLGAASVRHAR
jgi:hypothetical protein